jgi:hypothetical protein
MLLQLPALVALSLAPAPALETIASVHSDDWITAGYDCVHFGAGDLDGDGLAEILTINGGRALCAARSVHGWKCAPWEVLREEMPLGWTGLAVIDRDPNSPGAEVLVRYPDRVLLLKRTGNGIRYGEPEPIEIAWPDTAAPGAVEPPPYETDAKLLMSCGGDVDGDGNVDSIGIYSATKPSEYRMVRVAVALHDGNDADGDGVSDDREGELGSDRLDRDSDDDGLLDGWEVNGLPRGVDAFEGELSPTRRDLLLLVSRFVDLDEGVAKREVEKSKALYAAIPVKNLDGSSGITVHVRWTAPVPKEAQGAWWSVGNREVQPKERGVVHWMQITPGGGGQSQMNGDMGGAGAHWAAFGHEVGHQLGLSHEGDSTPPWCPLYPSLMNYAFNYSLGGDGNAIRFSDGRFRAAELRESALVERLPFRYEDVKYLAAHPFRFTLKEDGDGTLIDWDHSGTFDQGPLEADINYGGSTNCGRRLNVENAGAAPSLFVMGGATHLVTVDPKCNAIRVRECISEGVWSPSRLIPDSATRQDPVSVGIGDIAYVFFRSERAWYVARVTKEAIDPPVELDVRASGLAVGEVNGRALVVTRNDLDELDARWLTWDAKEKLSPPQRLSITSHVAPGIGQDPATKRIVVATSAKSPAGHDWCLRATWCSLNGDSLNEEESLWTRGERAANHCTTRPVVAFRKTPSGPELNLFHTGWFGPNGLTTAWRTRRVGNKALDDGWLTCLLYDEWTLTRVPVAFVDGPQGAIYSYRWDPGDHGDMTVNMVQTAHNGWGIDKEPMRDFDDGARITQWGMRHSILLMRPD